jgi:hypothetical protein
MARTDRVVLLEDGPWTEMVDAKSPAARKEGAYRYGQNVYPLDPALGDELVGRPGVRLLGARLTETGAHIQGIFQFSQPLTEMTVVVAGGRLFTIDWLTEAWTERVTAADLLTAGIVFNDVVTKVAFLIVSDQLMISDGYNAPFLWDGSAGSAGLTPMTNCPPLLGQPTMYESRVFGIKTYDPATMVWSETDDPLTGYEAGGFTNAWTIRQTNARPLTRLVGTNDGLVIFRERSVTIALGTVGPDFSTTATHDAIDSTRGTQTPFAVVEVGANILFLDAEMRPHILRPGGVGVEPIWDGVREIVADGGRMASPTTCIATHYTPANLVLFAIPNSVTSTSVGRMLVYDVSGDFPKAVGIWDGWTTVAGTNITALAMVLRTYLYGGNTPVLLHGDRGDNGGYVYQHGNPDDTSFLTDDEIVTGTQAITHTVECQALGFSTKRDKVFDRVDVTCRPLPQMTLNISVATPRDVGTPQTVFVNTGGQGWDYGLWDSGDLFDVATMEDEEQHADLGIDAFGRWARPKIVHQTIGERFGMVAVTVTGYATNDDPEIP